MPALYTAGTVGGRRFSRNGVWVRQVSLNVPNIVVLFNSYRLTLQIFIVKILTASKKRGLRLKALPF